MNVQPGLEHCLSFISSQMRTNGKARLGGAAEHMRAVTISRQAGCGALAVAQRLAEYLQARLPKEAARWTVFDRNLVETVLADHELPQRLAKFMTESWSSEIADALDELFGLHPPSWLLVRQTAETILRLAKLGNVILIGRGANIITARLSHVFHVRLVAPIEKRIQRIQETDMLDRKAAEKFVEVEDRGRRRYLRKFYRKDIDDALLYHLIINTGLVSYEEAARMIGDCLLERRAAVKLAA